MPDADTPAHPDPAGAGGGALDELERLDLDLLPEGLGMALVRATALVAEHRRVAAERDALRAKVLLAQQGLEIVAQNAEQAATGYVYDPSWIRPKPLPMELRYDRARNAMEWARQTLKDIALAPGGAGTPGEGTA